MTGTLAVMRREFGEKAFVLIAACALAFVPFLVTLIPGVKEFNAHQAIATTAAFLSVGFAWGLAVILGASVVGRDLSERRLSFYFARPISPAAIWFGKMAASLLMVLLSFAILFGPAIAVTMKAWRRSWDVDLRLFLAGVVLISIVLLFLTHALSTMIRSRSLLVAVDFVILIAVALVAAAIVLPLTSAFAFELASFVGASIGAAFVAALIGAGWYQLAEGRVERRESHRALSLALWSSVGCVLLLAAVYVGWVLSAKPKDLVSLLEVEQPDSGPWLIAGGRVRHRFDFRPRFLMNVNDGSSRRIGGAYRAGLDAFFSADGKTVGWVETTSPIDKQRFELVLQKLEPRGKPIETGISIRPFSEIALSDDATRVATFTDVVTIWDIAQHKLLGSFRLPKDKSRRWLSFFTDVNHLRIVGIYSDEEHRATDGPRDHTIRIFEYDIAKRAFATLGETHLVARNVGINANADASLLFVRAYGVADQTSLRLIDGRTAATISTIALPMTGWGGMYRILSNGTLAVSHHDNTNSTIRFYSLDGTLRHELPLSKYASVPAVGEIAPGRLLVAGYLGPDRAMPDRMKYWSAMLIDTTTGRVIQEAKGLWPMSHDALGGFSRDPRRRIITSPALFIDTNRALVSWNPTTGERKTILPAGAAGLD